MHQNAVLSPTKRSAISYKTQCYLLQNARLNDKYRSFGVYVVNSRMIEIDNFLGRKLVKMVLFSVKILFWGGCEKRLQANKEEG